MESTSKWNPQFYFLHTPENKFIRNWYWKNEILWKKMLTEINAEMRQRSLSIQHKNNANKTNKRALQLEWPIYFWSFSDIEMPLRTLLSTWTMSESESNRETKGEKLKIIKLNTNSSILSSWPDAQQRLTRSIQQDRECCCYQHSFMFSIEVRTFWRQIIISNWMWS